jgi:hypothetical protein
MLSDQGHSGHGISKNCPTIQKRRVTKLPSKTTPKAVVLGPEETAPLGTTVATGLMDAAASETLFNDEQD